MFRFRPDGTNQRGLAVMKVSPTGGQIISPLVYRAIDYDPVKSFAPIGLVAEGSIILVVNPLLRWRSVAELVADAKTNPKAIGWFVGQAMKASGGKANPQMVQELLRAALENISTGVSVVDAARIYSHVRVAQTLLRKPFPASMIVYKLRDPERAPALAKAPVARNSQNISRSRCFMRALRACQPLPPNRSSSTWA